MILTQSINAQQKLTHGILLGAGGGSFSNVETFISDNNVRRSLTYKYNLLLGYKLKICDDAKPYFFDMNMSFGIKPYDDYYYRKYDEEETSGGISAMFHTNNLMLLNLSFNSSFNYKIYKGLYTGIGLTPTIYMNRGTAKKYAFDIPLSAKIGYDLKFIGISIGYNYGMLNTLKLNKDYSKGMIREWQAQIFIPF